MQGRRRANYILELRRSFLHPVEGFEVEESLLRQIIGDGPAFDALHRNIRRPSIQGRRRASYIHELRRSFLHLVEGFEVEENLVPQPQNVLLSDLLSRLLEELRVDPRDTSFCLLLFVEEISILK